MQMSFINNPAERKWLILALALGVTALLFFWWTFVGFGGTATTNRPRTAATPSPTRTQRAGEVPETAQELKGTQLDQLSPINWPGAPPGVPEAKRNIFAYYEKPTPAPKPSV